MSRKNRNRTAAATVEAIEQMPAELLEMIGDTEAVIEVGESELIKDDQTDVSEGNVVAEDINEILTEVPPEGTIQGQIVGDVNPIVAAGYTKEQLYKDHKNHSGVIRWLAKPKSEGGGGFDRKHIAKYLGKRYQHIRNVLLQPIKKSQAA